MAQPTFEEITTTLTTDEGLTILNKARFHFMNPNGAYKLKVKADKLIDFAIEIGELKGGAIYAYGSLNDYHANSLLKLVMKKRPSRFDVDYAIEGLHKDIAIIKNVINELNAK